MAGRHAFSIELRGNGAGAEPLAPQRLDASDSGVGVVGAEDVRRFLRRFMRHLGWRDMRRILRRYVRHHVRPRSLSEKKAIEK